MLVEDITEQRIAGRALKESEARFRRIADSAPVPMWVTRLDRSRDFVNDAYVELMGVDREEALRIEWSTRIHPDDRPLMIAETNAGEASGEQLTPSRRGSSCRRATIAGCAPCRSRGATPRAS